ncbi:MAG TPA: hypothetical protein VM510_01080 [Caulifigura sp.]|nr:hypothetical protein [Caulifigura sp.]
MSVSISCSPKSKDTWFLNNLAFAWFKGIICVRHADDVEALELLEITHVTNGCYLDGMASENLSGCATFIDILKIEAARIASGEEPIPDRLRLEKADLRNHFSALVGLLDRFESRLPH